MFAKATLQLGEASVIAERTGITTISDFRSADVAYGGNGAPLTTTFDQLILRSDRWTAVQNIGGIGNVTFLSPRGNDTDPIGFDTGPGNVLIDHAAWLASNGSLLYDHDGSMGRSGKPNIDMLKQMQEMPYFDQIPPKTTGRELFTKDMVLHWWKKVEDQELSANDFVSTMTELTAWSIADSYRRYGPQELERIVLSGGGSQNGYLIERLRHHLLLQFDRPFEGDAIEIHQHWESKEGQLFAMLAFRCIKNQFGNLPSCTGARSKVVLGKISPASNLIHLSMHFRDSENKATERQAKSCG
eukprot:TRINITY_DN3415_c0_g1_i4.p1 TRINITY_DN3415_c0_g1~~TRINITY_DN3415_c0_g1_i4.p1  ORF type:complete len:300 (-),score=58.58 TRINITY_DN3415_c0_g1_i4:214-1113(-)